MDKSYMIIDFLLFLPLIIVYWNLIGNFYAKCNLCS